MVHDGKLPMVDQREQHNEMARHEIKNRLGKLGEQMLDVFEQIDDFEQLQSLLEKYEELVKKIDSVRLSQSKLEGEEGQKKVPMVQKIDLYLSNLPGVRVRLETITDDSNEILHLSYINDSK